MTPVIAIAGTHPTVKFAARELARYLKRATGQAVAVVKEGKAPAGAETLRVGVCGDVGIERPKGVGADRDWVCVRGGILTGSNPRSVLFAVYRYLHELGFRWIRPGSRGEIVPKLDAVIRPGIRIDETPSYRFRTICIEGACSFEHVRDLIDWSAKQGMNGYFLQFELGTWFFKKWYEHHASPYWKGEPFDIPEAEKVVDRVIAELRKRDLYFERVGHGWTCAALGMPGEGWGKEEKIEVPPGKEDWIAEMGGKREWFGGVPLNTNLCYSKPEVRAAITAVIAAYAGHHPEADLVHVWLADGSNNNCECDECRKIRPADLYVDMLNELDEKLTAAGLGTKIVFLIYVDLLWPPKKRRIKNPDRFVLMFAPITRSYASSYLDAKDDGKGMTPFRRNKLDFPRSVVANLAYLGEWQRDFTGPGFVFDYHLIWPLYFDLNNLALSEVLNKDIRSLTKMGLDGLNSCQVQRQGFPHNLLMDVTAQTLWDKKRSFRRILESTFDDAFGADADKVVAFFKAVTKLWLPFFEPVFIPEPDEARIAKGLKNIPKILPLADALRPVVQKNVKSTTGAVQWSWRYLSKYLDLLPTLVAAVEAYLRCGPDVREKFKAVHDFLWRNEKMLHPVIDVEMCYRTQMWRVNEAETSRKERGLS